MQAHHINPHVLNSLYCLLGIALCLVLIVWGKICDRRYLKAQAEVQRRRPAAPARQPHAQGDPIRHEA
ncbi:MAG TPA: hypothetical protein PKW05_13575, partial [Anaerolineae bacterium]|nr:hypothetical protein [Anaerolineae bacterium]